MFFLPANQRVIWFEQKLFPESAIYNVGAYTLIHGSIDTTLFEKAINILIAQNDALRATFEEIEGIPRLLLQTADTAPAFHLPFLDFSTQENSREACISWMNAQNTLPLSFAENKLYTFALLKQSDTAFFWYAKVHHTLLDGWGVSLLVSKLAAIYETLVKGNTAPAATAFSYVDYIRADEAYTSSPLFTADKLYWKDRFATVPPTLSAGIREEKKEELLLSSIRKSVFIDKAQYEAIRLLASRNKVTTFHVFLGIFYTWFSRTSQISDLVIGVPVRNRETPAFLETLGVFVGVLPFRMNYASSLAFEQLLPQIRDAFRQDMQHQKFPVDEIIRIAKAKEPELPSLFDISLSFEKQSHHVLFNTFETETVALHHQAEKTPLSIFVRECQGTNDIKIDFDFNLGHWEEYYMDQLLEQFRFLLTTLITAPEQTIHQVPLVTAQTKAALLSPHHNATPYTGTLVTHFEKTVAAWPDNTAVAFETQQFTYAALNAQANAVAHYLRNNYQVQPNEIVAFMIPKSANAIITILGILKSGAAYLPVDPAYPEERKKFMLENSGTRLLLTESNIGLPAFEGDVLFIDQQAYLQESTANPLPVNTPNDTSYIIYTSGSTGTPKGTVIKHAGAVNVALEYLREINLQPAEHFLQFASLSFDGSVLEIFLTLFSGATLYPVSKDIIADFDSFSNFIIEKEIAALILPPSYLRNLNKACLANVRALITGGEAAIPRPELNLRDDQEYCNAYGPTECSVSATLYKETKNTSRNVPIGKPIGNMQVYILDQQLQLMPYGVPGEIYIAGIGLAKGYLNNAALTDTKFIPSPFNKEELLYRSGDIGRWLSDGNIEFLGRADDQVKIRGHRIEPGEIEVALAHHAAVKNVAVAIKEFSREEKLLYAFVVPKHNITTDALYTFLRRSLPHFMIPDRIFLVEEIPLTINGKIDKKALLNIDIFESDKTIIAPGTENEKMVAGIWRELLGITQLSITDNFFQLGGHSLKVGQFINSLYKQTNIRLAFSEVFRTAVLRDVAALISTKKSVVTPALVKVAERDYYPQSSSQKRLYLLQQIEHAGTSYNIPGAFRIKGAIDIAHLEQCFTTLIARHEALRTAFEMRDGMPVQIIKKDLPFHIGYTKALTTDREQLLSSFVRTFDLSAPPLLRAQVYEFGASEQWFLFDMHHIISDGISSAIFFEELMQLYNGESLEPLDIQYKDFAVWQNNILASDHIKEQEKYWLQQFAEEAPVLSLQTDFPRPAEKSFKGKRIHVDVPADICHKIDALSIQLDCTINQLLLAAFNVLLYKYTGNEDIVVGTPVSGRIREELDHVLGVFINTLALRSCPAGNKTFKDFLAEVKQTSVEALKNQEYPFELLIDQLNGKRDTSRHPLFDIMFSFLHENRSYLPLGKAILEPVKDRYDTSKFDLLLEVVKTGHHLTLNLEYSTDLFSGNTAVNILRHYVTGLQQIVAHPDKKLSAINILTPAEEQWLLTGNNNTLANYPTGICLHQLFEEQVSKFPHKTALVWNSEEITYASLNAKANQVAAAINAVLPGAKNPIIAVLLDRSPEMIAALLGILKAGGAYLPMDPDYPADRISYMLEDSNAPLLLTHTTVARDFQYNGSTLFIDQLKETISFNPVAVQPSDLAYIIYTSGSTGKPKGVMIEHRNVVRLLFNDKNLFDFTEHDTWTLFHSYCFDFSVWEMYGALLFGGKLVIIPKTIAQNTKDFLHLLQQQQVTVLNQTPGAFYNLLAAELEQTTADLHLRYVIFGGEALKPGKLKGWPERYPGCRLINMYGITETTVHVTYKEITQKEIDANTSNIGQPIPTLSLLVVNKDLQLVAPGVAGELCVGGAGLARGYLNRPELTAERFIPHPYAPGEKLYRTGDLAKMLPDGDFEYLGRIDHQVKIRGFRIELGEIESKLLLHDAVKDTLVIDREDPAGDKYLCAYVVSAQLLTAADLRKHLSAFLPDYMVPAFFIVMDHFPLTGNGKIDRKQLPLPEETDLSTAAYEAPVTPTEIQLAALWSKLLNVSKVGLHDHFFELGGQSLKAVNAVAGIFKTFQVSLPLNIFFKKPTVKEQAAYIDSHQKEGANLILPAPVQAYYPQSSSQKRLFLLHQIEGSENSYNIPRAFRIKGNIDIAKLEQCFTTLITRHEALRTAFEMKDGMPVQIIKTNLPFSIGYTKAEPAAQEQLIRSFIRTFDLSAPPLLRAHVLDAGSEQWFLFDMHHIISDGISSAVFMEELMQLYNGEQLEPLTIQYKDVAVWQNNYLASDHIKEQENYWLQQFAQEVPVLSLQTDYPRPAQKSFNGKRKYIALTENVSRQLDKLATKLDCTTNHLMLAAFKVLLYKYAGSEDMVVGTPVAGRTRAELDKVLGVFINTLALRSFPSGNKTFKNFLAEVKQTSVDALKNQEYPFELLIDQLNGKRDMSRNPLFDIMFSFLQNDQSDISLGTAILEPVKDIYDSSKFDLLLEAVKTTRHMELTLEYSTDLFSEAAATALLQHYINLLQQITALPDKKLSAINILTPAEEQWLLTGNNNTHANYPIGICLHQLFEEQVSKFPHHTALVWNSEEITYAALNTKANQVAAAIKATLPDAKNPIIAVLLDRSPEMIAALLGILKAGGAYLPMDPDYPADRISYMLEDSNAPLLLTHTTVARDFQYNGSTLFIDQLKETISFNPVAVQPSDLAYIIYTSGSTGKPKGVMIEHRNVVRLLFNDKNLFDFTEHDTWTLFHSYCFDFSVWEMYGALLFGGKLVIIPKTIAQNTKDFLHLLQQQQVTVLNQTPGAFYNLLAAELEQTTADLHLRYVIFGGEALKPGKLKGWPERYPGCRLINMYGITETTVHVTYKEITQKEIDANTSNIGQPIPTLSLLVVNKDLQLVAPGVAGELCVGGAGLARGYLNRPELTAERFIPHPYAPGEKLYRTGDLAKMLPDGDVEYLGRIDHQVKIRGFRIELGEIENKLLLHDAVKDTLVIDREDHAGDKYLCAYVVSPQPLTATDLRKHLSAFLPDYMVPAFFIVMDHFPLTGNGKIDRKRLPLPEETDLSTAAYEAPVTPVEKQLAALWRKLLNVPKVGRNDHFFELGGQSLRAAQLAALIHKHFQVEISIKQIFTTPHLSVLAERILESAHAEHQVIERAPAQPWYPASAAEKRLYIVNQIDGAGISYNIPAAYAIEGNPDLKKFAKAIRSLVNRHEILRTSFSIKNGEVIQLIHDDIAADIAMHHCEEEDLPELIRGFIQPFDLSQAPLFRTALVSNTSGQHYFLFDLHHMIGDAVTLDNLLKELAAIYSGTELPPLRIQSRDVAVWQKNWLQSTVALAQQAFWKAQFPEETAVLNMPVDHVRPPVKSYEGELFSCTIPAPIAAAVKEISRAGGATTFMVMLAAYNILLSKYSGQEDIIVGTPVAGRSNADVQDLLGLFVNTLPLRNFPAPGKQFNDFVAEVKEQSLKAFQHRDYPLEELMDDLQVTRDMSRNPLFDYMFSYQTGNKNELPFADLRLKQLPMEHTIAKMDLSLQVSEEENGIMLLGIEYATRIFSRPTIKRIAAHFIHILEQVTHHPQIRISDIDITTNKEKEQLRHFNDTARQAGIPGKEAINDIYELVESNIHSSPDKVAVATDTTTLTYRELGEKVAGLAAILTAAGAGTNKIAGVYMDRSADMIVAILAILKAGAAYLPIDPDYPADRIRYMLEDSNALLVLTQQSMADGLPIATRKIFMEELTLPAITAETEKSHRPAHSLAYVIYTSGSTGKPKGVMIEHHSFYNSVLSNAANYSNGFSTADVGLSLSNISFDASILEIFIPLIYGAKLVIVKRENVYDVQSLAQVIVSSGITFCYVPPSLLQPLYRALKGHAPIPLNKLYVGVEPIKDTTLQQYISLNENMHIINGYGPTEAAIACSWYGFKPGTPRGVNIPIGKPIHNARIYIVNDYMQLMPVGVPGELCIAGAGLARGYLNNPQLTDEKFVPNPFEPGQKLYKTGDLAKWLPDGNIMFIGRKDHQVKIRGFRIELGEIENKLMTHPDIRQALVIDKTDQGGHKFLCAYVVSTKQPDHAALRAHLATELPAYMMPAFFITLEKFPLTSNEKIDRKALPEPDTAQQTLRAELVLPEDATEEKMLEIWETILETDNISITDNFFEIGGNSLKIINMLGLIQESFGNSLKVSDLFDKPTIKEQAATISKNINKVSRQSSKTKRVEF
jgi:amino acid adenylation domain-containing protein